MEFLKIGVPLLAAVVAWFANEWRKRAWEEYVRKEENYKQLLRASRGFYVDSQNPEQKSEFLQNLDFCWLYSTDEVIEAAYQFLDTVKAGAESTELERARAWGKVVAAMRTDLLQRRVTRKTQLEATDYRLLRST